MNRRGTPHVAPRPSALGLRRSRLLPSRTTRVAAGLASAVAVVALTGAPASARPIVNDRLEACRAGACGSATFNWGTRSLTNVRMHVRDTACDGNAAFIRFRVWTTNPQYAFDYTTTRKNSKGCNQDANWSGLSYQTSHNITALEVQVCVDQAVDQCKFSPRVANPAFGG